MIINFYAILFVIWEFWESLYPNVGVLENMASCSYTYKKKVYVGKMKRQANQSQGIMAQMMYYSK